MLVVKLINEKIVDELGNKLAELLKEDSNGSIDNS